ncbi:hypothetical protein GUITHDRAFT_115390 [Guillardia theta CCMP2712]|uniref:Uncharacterized protein n=1 Tax=Guillardia theta (strain CCMP2712) TaxID=905079 RepID=L1IR94_GUITC|nr:hypothetical protein GUITHDRAFT_115390 [Guillardia theta CCMP2712]EKX38419.1 hypothetical protein GUITHDRAFT_115390 [Guillardia theta CCMP2712]|eukprot:XP_005825399.1 hypothetical protein GUITHDRAFT_115390 [Guillardia theta CCMP2712]
MRASLQPIFKDNQRPDQSGVILPGDELVMIDGVSPPKEEQLTGPEGSYVVLTFLRTSGEEERSEPRVLPAIPLAAQAKSTEGFTFSLNLMRGGIEFIELARGSYELQVRCQDLQALVQDAEAVADENVRLKVLMLVEE